MLKKFPDTLFIVVNWVPKNALSLELLLRQKSLSRTRLGVIVGRYGLGVLVNLVNKELVLRQVDPNDGFLLVLQLNNIGPLLLVIIRLVKMRLNVLFDIGTPPVVLVRVVQINVEFNDLLGSLLNYCFHEAALLL